MRILIRILCLTGIVLLTLFSAGATSVGFVDYGLPREFALATASVIEVVLLAGLFVSLDGLNQKWMRVAGFMLYVLFAAVSVYGSFVAINALLVVPDRRQENAQAVCEQYREYVGALETYVNERYQSLNRAALLLSSAKAAEDRIGYVSRKGSGKLEMYTTIEAVERGVDGLRDQFDPGRRVAAEGEERTIIGCGSDRNCCMAVAREESRSVDHLPADDIVKVSLGEVTKLLGQAPHGDLYATSVPALPRPAAPRISVPEVGSRRELVDEAWQELATRSRPETLRAFAASVLIDIGILVLAVLQHFLRPTAGSRRRPPSARSGLHPI